VTSMSRTTAYTLGLVSIVGIVLCSYWSRGPYQTQSNLHATVLDNDSEDDSVKMAESRKLDALEEEVATLRREMVLLRSERSRSLGPAATPAGTSHPPPARRDAEILAATREARHSAIADIEADFSMEVRDATWSSATAGNIQDIARMNESIGNALRSVECRSRSCRVEIVDDASADTTNNLPTFLMALGSTLPNTVADHVQAPDGHQIYVIYMTRGDT
jgi:hypothetical protein